MAELNLQAIKDRVARGRLQGGNPTGGEDGPFHLYHIALDDLDALIAHLESDDHIAAEKTAHPLIDVNTPDRNDLAGMSKADADDLVARMQPPHPRVAELSDEKRAELLAVAEEHKE